MKVVIVGNGILGLMTAYQLTQSDPSAGVALIGPSSHDGCASLAAAAMFNSFCEIETSTLSNQYEKQKFLFNKSANKKWPHLIHQLQSESDQKLEFGFGTYLINNHASDQLEDDHFDAIISALEEFHEPFEMVSPSNIPRYKPSSSGRASRALFIPQEGWINPQTLFSALKKILLSNNKFSFIDQRCRNLQFGGNKIEGILLENNEVISGDAYLLTPGCTFSKIISESKLDLNFPRIFSGVGTSLLLKTGNDTIQNCIRTPNRGLACGVYSAPQDSEHTLIGASNFICNEAEQFPRVTSVYSLLGAAMEQINSDYYRSLLVKVQIGWRPLSEDTLPLIGATSIQNLWVATGTGRDGLHCSPIISEYLTNLILHRGSTPSLDLFTPERNPTHIYSRKEAIDRGVRHTINALYQHGFRPSHNRILEDLTHFYHKDLTDLHDRVGATDWGIPTDMINMYRYNHLPKSSKK